MRPISHTGRHSNHRLLRQTALSHTELRGFIQTLTLGRESDLSRRSETKGRMKRGGEAVSLMTVHGAKGLEFPAVFICGVNEGLLPYKNPSESFITDKDEERRLFYTALTRAKDELILTYYGTPSPFLTELPKGLTIKEVIPRRTERLMEQMDLFGL